MKRVFRFLFPLLLIGGISCSTESAIQQIIGINAEAPVFLEYRPISSTEVVFKFSQPVRLVSLHFDTELNLESVEEGEELKVTFARALREGQKVTADILVENAGRSTLNVIVPFRTRNDRMPTLVFNELRTEYSRPRTEFVEFFASGPGNLGALRLFVASYSLTRPLYEFPPAEVRAGDYIVLNLRTLEEGSVDTATEFWLPGAVKRLRRTDALWIVDQDERIIDAVFLSESPESAWNNNIAQAADFLAAQGAWHGGPVISAGTTATRTINRNESIAPQRRAENWYITATSGNTPGRPNDPRRHAQ
ncbi:MAG: hypothetical protein FWH19_03970 [Treponema sp.]|nr:hypothetical protein [Treponema sp.]